jgi:hypothetical protein
MLAFKSKHTKKPMKAQPSRLICLSSPKRRAEGNPVFPTKEHQEIGALFLCSKPLWIRVLA